MPKSRQSLNELLHEIRRIEESRTVLTEKKIRKIYRQLLKELNGFIGSTYTKYADGSGALTVAELQRASKLAWFLGEIDKNCSEYLPDISKEIRQLINTVYDNCYKGMAKAVNESYDLNALEGVRPEVMESAINNQIQKLTLPSLLEKHRKEIIYEIKQAISIGLMNGERYESMTRKIVEKLDFSYAKADNIIRTETHRNVESGFMDCAKDIQKNLDGSGLVYTATWRTMKDERVRPQQRRHTKSGWKTTVRGKADHQKMEGVTIKVGEKFELEPGVFAECPGMSGIARHDCRCRCFLEYDISEKPLTPGEESGIIKINNKIPFSELNKKIRPTKQQEHILGSKSWLKESKRLISENKTPKSFLFKNQDAQMLVDTFSGKGTLLYKPNNQYPIEFVDCSEIIGKTFDTKVGKYINTNRIAIVYSSKGAHIYPVIKNKE